MGTVSGKQAWPAVAKLLGIDSKNVIRLTLTVDRHEAAKVELVQYVTGLQELSEVTEQFNLVPAEPDVSVETIPEVE